MALRVAIVGAGMMGRWHAAYSVKAGGQLAAIVDRDVRNAVALRRKLGEGEVFTDLGECLARCDVDIVHICTPSASHESLAEVVLAAGKHVLVEKPAACTPAAAEKLIALSVQKGARICPVHQFPFQRGFRRIREQINRLGKLVSVKCVSCTAGADSLTGQARRNLLLEILPHAASIFRSLCPNSMVRASWTVLPTASDEIEVAGLMDDVHLGIQISLRGRPPRNEMTIIGTSGTAHLNLFHGYGFFEFGRGNRTTKFLQPFTHATSQFAWAGLNLLIRAWRREPAFPGLAELIAVFYRSILENGYPPVEPREILEAACFMSHVCEIIPQSGQFELRLPT